MAVPEQTPYIEHTGNGVTTSFALEFQCESKDHLIVLVDEIEPPIATWSLTGGNVVFTTAPTSGQKITIQRNTPFGRATNYQSFNNSFRPQTVNIDFDRIWLKLQELGVADWLMKLYVDRLHQQQEQKINDLKGYVDDRDDELRAYLMEEIRKQGVALDQLDDYYNYLMQRLAQIAVDKGWEASFVVDASGKTQQEINDARVVVVGSIADLLALPERARREDLHYSVAGLTFSYNGSEFVNISGYITAEAFGAKFDGVVSDTLPLQEAIEYAAEKNIPLVTFRRQCFLAEAVVVKSIVWNSLGTEFVTSEVGKPAIVAFNEAPKLLGVFRTTGAYDATQSFPTSVATAEHPAGSYAASTLDFLYSSLPPSSSDTGILFRFTQKQYGIRVGEVHVKRHGTGVYWLSNSAPTDEYTNNTVIDAIYHEDVWCGIVMFGAVDFRCKTVKGSYFRRLPPLENDPAHCVYLGDRANPNRSRDLTFDHVENVVTDRTPDSGDGVFSVKGADNVLIKTLIAREVPAGGTINGECRIQNLYSFADEKIIPFVWLTDNNSEGGFWSREQAGTSICVIENAVVRNNTGRGSDVLGSQQMALFCCYGGSRLRGTYSSISVQNLDAVLGGVNPMHIAIQESDEVCMRGRVRYNNYLTNPALYNYGDNDGAFPTWAALYPVIFLWPDTEVTQTVELEIIGYRWAVGTAGAPVNATFTCVPKGRVATEVVELGDIRKDMTGYYSADSAGLSSEVTWTPYPFSFSHMHSYRSRFKTSVYGLRTPLYAEPPVQYDTSESTFRPYGQPVTAIRHTGSTKQIIDVQSLPVGQTCRLLNVDGNVTLVHEYNQNALKCTSAADYSAWLVADVVNMGGAQRLVAAY